MSLVAECKLCGKRYTVGDQFAGKVAKCKCGATIQIPGGEPPPLEPGADGGAESDDLGAIERTGAVTRNVVKPPPLPGASKPATQGMTPPPLPPAVKSGGSGKYDDLLHSIVPLGMILAGYGLPLAAIIWAYVKLDSTIPQRIALGSIVLAFFAVAMPVTIGATIFAARALDFELFDHPYFRVAASFAAAPLMTCVVLLIQHSTLPAIQPGNAAIWGCSLGGLVSFFVLWLQLRVDLRRAIPTWLFTVGGYVVGLVLAFFLLGAALVEAKKLFPRQIASWQRPPPGKVLVPMDPLTPEYKSGDNLRAILNAWVRSSPLNYPHDLSDLGLTPDQTTSPFGHRSGGPDYVYVFGKLEGRRSAFGGHFILAYDASELDEDGRTTLITTGGDVEIMYDDEFRDDLSQTNKMIDDLNSDYDAKQQAVTDQIAAQKKREADAEAAFQAQQQQEEAARQARLAQIQAEAAAQASQQQASQPPQQPVAENTSPTPVPVIVKAVAAKWSGATADPTPVLRVGIRRLIKMIVPYGTDLAYPPQSSNIVGVGDAFDESSTNATDIHEIWNLGLCVRTGRIVGALPLKDSVISPDGAFIAGLATGRTDAASVFQIWSLRLGRRFQTVAQPPVHQNARPRVIGFVTGETFNEDQLLVLGDGLDVYDIRTGSLKKQTDLDVNWTIDPVTAVSATGKLAAIWDTDNRITLIDTEAGQVLGSAEMPPGQNSDAQPERALAFSPDGTQLAAYRGDGKLVAWSVTSGQLMGDYDTNIPFHRLAEGNDRRLPLVWLPDSSGWIVADKTIVDGASGVELYQIPPQTIARADEYGPRMLIDDEHVMMSFKAWSKQIGFGSFPIPQDVLAKARTAARATTQP